MAASSGDEFDIWFSEKLTNICPDVDLDVFVQYVRGVLETDTDMEDKTESITDILGEITVWTFIGFDSRAKPASWLSMLL